eukprot:49472-Prymnesium_polylepis.1
MRPTDARARVRSAEFVWGLQRRSGFHVSAAQTDLLQLDTHTGVLMDPLGDDIATDPHTDKRKPHDAALRVWHAATQASATHTVVLGDKEHPELYSVYNEGC